MSAGLKPLSQAFTPAADLSALQYTFVKMTADQTVGGCSANDEADGILMNAPVLKDVAEVSVALGARLKVSGAVVPGDYLRADTGGLGKVVTTGFANAKAMGGGVANDVIPVLVVQIWLG